MYALSFLLQNGELYEKIISLGCFFLIAAAVITGAVVLSADSIAIPDLRLLQNIPPPSAYPIRVVRSNPCNCPLRENCSYRLFRFMSHITAIFRCNNGIQIKNSKKTADLIDRLSKV